MSYFPVESRESPAFNQEKPMFELIRFASAVILALGLSLGSDARAADTYGEGVSDAAIIDINELINHPDRYVDRKVKIAGLVDDVCPMKGCWVEILAAQARETIRFKVQDDVIVFPVEAKGSEIVAEGILRKHEMSKAQSIDWLRHLAEEKGESFDASTVTGPTAFYQIEGLGAIVGG